MKGHKDKLEDSKKLRKRADKELKDEPGRSADMSGDEATTKTIHELQVHQIELEMQNEELRRAQLELEESRGRYADLYDFAPVGYFVLDRNGLILDLNLTGATLLCVERSNLVDKPLSLFIARGDRDQFYLYQRHVFETEEQQSCELKLVRKDGSELYGRLDSHVVKDAEGKFTRCRTAISDVTQRKRAEDVLKLHEMRLQALLDLNKMTEASRGKILDFVREEMVKITQSQFAFLGFLDDDESIMTIDSWSKEAMEQCAVVDKPMDFAIEESGLWGEPVRQRTSVLVNNYNAPHPRKRGFPRGHVPIERFLGVPVFDGEAIVAVGAVANKPCDYNTSDVRAITSLMNDMWRLISRRRSEENLEKSEANYRAIFDNANDAIFVHDIESLKLLGANRKACEMYGYTPEEFKELAVEDISAGAPPHSRESTRRWTEKAAEEGPKLFEWMCKDKTGRNFWVEINLRLAAIEDRQRILAIVRDISERKAIEAHQQLAGQILRCLNHGSTRVDLVRDVLKLVKKATGFDAVAIRQCEGEDFPYLEVDGFGDDFVAAENYLCSRDEAGELIYDSQGRPVIGCMCGNVLRSRTDATLPFFTEGGSFWTNSTTALLASTHPEVLQVPTRNHCHQAGYESVALVPLRSGEEIVGLLQLNDTRPGRFTVEMIRFLEEIGASIGMGMARARAEREIENLAKFPSENPNPVLRITREGVVLYANTAGSRLLVNRDCKVGESAPEHWRQDIVRILESGSSDALEAVCEDRIFSLIIAPVADAGYVNVYGIDVTERKHAEEDLREYRHQLEELVQTRTAELTKSNEKLVQEIEQRKRLEQEILNISEREQRRIGRELHDSIGQQFTGIAFMMKVLEQKLKHKLPEEATGAAEIKKLVNQALDQTRGLAKGLHPIDLDAGSLTAALQELAATTEMMFGVRCVLICDEPVAIDDAEVATHLYRITQEAITNAIKHGKAKHIRIELACNANETVLTVENDGLDFPEELGARGTGMGLHIMNHRADIIGASLDISKAAGNGTIVSCSFGNHGR